MTREEFQGSTFQLSSGIVQENSNNADQHCSVLKNRYLKQIVYVYCCITDFKSLQTMPLFNMSKLYKIVIKL